ncbi:hypothetical protein C8Q79DRAFT_984858, partial [Trametes meyenii]
MQILVRSSVCSCLLGIAGWLVVPVPSSRSSRMKLAIFPGMPALPRFSPVEATSDSTAPTMPVTLGDSGTGYATVPSAKTATETTTESMQLRYFMVRKECGECIIT